ncbi:MAG: nitrate- and nitrite sensing domain-containing protein [Halothiobacillus sp.]
MTTALDFMLAARRSELQALQNLAVTSALVGAVSRLVHALQRERGFSNLHLGSQDQRFLESLTQLSAHSHEAGQELRACFNDMDIDRGCGADRVRLLNRIALAVYLLDNVPRLRHKVRERLLRPVEAIQQFTHAIAALLAVVFEAADTAVDPQITSALVALFNFMQSKELAGQERATGVAGFAAGYFEPRLLNKMQFLQEGQQRCLATFKEFAEAPSWQFWMEQDVPELNFELAKLRQMAERTSVHDRVSPNLGEVWFEITSMRIDAMKGVEDTLTARLRAICEQKILLAKAQLDDQRVWLDRLASIEETSEFPTARLFNVQVTELGTLPMDSPGSQLSRSILDVLHAQTLRLQAVSDELDVARLSLNERKLIERAKGKLMQQGQLPEDEAYRLLRQRAMDQGLKLIEVAKRVLGSGDVCR